MILRDEKAMRFASIPVIKGGQGGLLLTLQGESH